MPEGSRSSGKISLREPSSRGWRSSGGAISLHTRRLPIVEVTFHGPMPGLGEYEEAFREYARLASAGEPLLWLIDMRTFDALGVDATVRQEASRMFHRYRDQLRPVSVAEARVTRDRLTRFILTAFDWLTIADKWPCQQFETPGEAEAWLRQRLAEHPRG